MEKKLIPMFVYGTLMNQATLDYLGVAPEGIVKATLEGYNKIGLNIEESPYPKDIVTGHYFHISEQELKILDSYEAVEHNWYHRFLINIRVGDTWKRAYAYQLTGK